MNPPSITSSPTRGTFTTTINRNTSPGPIQRHATTRGRQNSNQSIAHEGARKRPASVTPQSKPHAGAPGSVADTRRDFGDKNNELRPSGSRRGPVDGTLNNASTKHGNEQPGELSSTNADILKQEDTEQGSPNGVVPSIDGEKMGLGIVMQPRLDSRRASRTSKPATPAEVPSSETSRSRPSRAAAQNGGLARAMSPPPRSSGTSPKKTRNQHSGRLDASRGSSVEQERLKPARQDYTASDAGDLATEEVEENDDDDDDDDDEQKYCVCQSVSYGDMVACDNKNCPYEWFHLTCMGLERPPSSKTKWYCRAECREEARRFSKR